MPDSERLTLQKGGGRKCPRDIFLLLLLLKSILLTCRVSFYYFKHFSPTVIPHYRSMLIKLVACSEEKKMLFIRCVLAEHAESNCCLLQLVICFLWLLSLLPNIPPSKVNRFGGKKPEHRCQTLELYCSQLDHTGCACFLRARSWPISRLGPGHGFVLNPPRLCAFGRRIHPHELLASGSVLYCRAIDSKQDKFIEIPGHPSMLLFETRCFDKVFGNTRKASHWNNP